ncbi:MAG: hypothetical protein V4663_09465 [Bacteroidota bacterium]
MKASKFLALFAITCLGFSCNNKMCCTDINVHVDLKINNSQGQNLLATPATFDKKNIEVFYVVDGKPERYDRPNLDASGAFILFDDLSGIRVFLNHNKDEKRPVTLIKFGNTKTDTISAEFTRNGSSTQLKKVWLNGVLKERSFMIIK